MQHHSFKKSPAACVARTGAILVAALICLSLTLFFQGVLLKTATTHRRQTRWDVRQVQTDWLIESAIARAAWRLDQHADYQGETWNVTSSELDGRHNAAVQIQVAAGASEPRRRDVTIVARYPAGGTQQVKRTKRIRMQLKQ